MAVSLLFDNVMESFTTTGTGTVTLLGAETGSQSFAVVGNLNTTVTTAWAVDANDNPSGAWEVATDAVYTVSGTTMSRGVLLASSTGSVISWAAGKKRIAQGIPALFFNAMRLSTKGAIQGLELAYSTTPAIRVRAGTCAINNKLLSMAQTDYTSGGTMKDLSNATVTLAANSAYFTYAHDASGTLGARFEKYTGSGNGDVPTFVTDVDYFASPVGVIDRRIGGFWTDGSANIIPFVTVNCDRYRKFLMVNADSKRLVSGVNNPTFTAITIIPYITNDILEIRVEPFTVGVITSTSTGIAISIDGGSTAYEFNDLEAHVANTGTLQVLMPTDLVPNTGTLHYQTVGTNTLGFVSLSGFTEFV